ncbi:PQ loop repeat protein [Microthyrium microscopicum]|uniref:PQ loop repeat protein n=1 Tax=Microthyrium microscopicum TaxID=703497 RepID=A0A6A6UK72_9PEZI|nr:PQ loop repeat protein [Microthyrium microscopicum]
MDLPNCRREPAEPSLVLFSFRALIVLGILVSYIPQHLRIITRRSSEGLSPYFVLLGTTSSTFSLFNVITDPGSQDNIACCTEISRFACTAGLLGIAQIAVQWGCFSIIMILFLIFFPQPGPEPHPSDAPARPTYKTALLVVFTCIVHFVALLILSSVFLLWYKAYLGPWSTTLGICAAILAAVQYLPQLYTTWKLQHVMSLSIPMMCIQTPGSFVFAASLAGEYGLKGWSVWGVYVLTGFLQGGLLAMGIYFELRDRKARQLEGSEQENQDTSPSERTALLGDSNGHANHGTNT